MRWRGRELLFGDGGIRNLTRSSELKLEGGKYAV